MESSGERILLVDDDELVRKLVQRQLTGLGYEVVTARDGNEALEALKAQEFDLLFTDMVMPGGMSGRELALKVRAIKPELPILLSSGFLDDAMGEDDPLKGHLTLLAKPYRKADLAAKVREVLNAAAGP